MSDDKPSLKERAGEWLFQQGVSTVLLFSILVLLAYGVPWGYREFKTWHDTSEDKRIDERKEAAKIVAEALTKSNVANTDSLIQVTKSLMANTENIGRNSEISREAKEAIKELTAEIRKDRIERREPKGVH